MSAEPGAPGAGQRIGTPLAVQVDLAAGRVTLTGRLDRRTAYLVHAAISGLLTTDRMVWVVDVTALTVGDHSAVRAIGNAYRRALRHGRRLTLLGASGTLRHDLTRLRLGQHVLDDADAVDDDSAAPSP